MLKNTNQKITRHPEFISGSTRHCEQSEAIWFENTRHSEFISGSNRHCEQSEAIWTRLPRPNGLAMTNETGRSMVEMLGVLAVIGVLSITGISGYNTAMNKHRANEILDAASKRAVAVSTQIQRGNTSPTLGEFGDETAKGVSFSLKATDGSAWATGQERFALQTSAIDKDICREIYNITGTSGTVREMYSDSNALSSSSGCSDTASAMRFVYNNDLTNTAVASDYKDQASCTAAGKSWCSNNTCAESCGPTCPGDSSSTAITNGTSFAYTDSGETITCWCPSGKSFQGNACTNAPTEACSDYTSTECGLGYYCLFTTGVTSESSGTGTCQPVGNHATNTSYYGTSHELWKSTTAGPSSNGKMNWWSAKSWCLAQGKDLLDISETKLGCYPSSGMTTALNIVSGQYVGYCCSSDYPGTCSSNKTTQSAKVQALRDGSLGTSGYVWTDTDYSASRAYNVYLDGSVGNANRNGSGYGLGYAMCE